MEVVLYVAFLGGVLLVLPGASFRLMRSMNAEADRLRVRVDMLTLDQRLAQVFSCGEIVEISPNRVVVQCIDRVASLTARADDSLELAWSYEVASHVLAFPGYVHPVLDEPMFAVTGPSGQAVRVHLWYRHIEFTKTYYAATAL